MFIKEVIYMCLIFLLTYFFSIVVCVCVLGCSVAGGGAEAGRRSQRGLPQPGAHSVHREDSQHYDEE